MDFEIVIISNIKPTKYPQDLRAHFEVLNNHSLFFSSRYTPNVFCMGSLGFDNEEFPPEIQKLAKTQLPFDLTKTIFFLYTA